MAYGYLTSTLLMGVVLVLITGATLGRRRGGAPVADWRAESSTGAWYFDAVENLTTNPTAWLVAFLVLAGGAGGAAILYLSRPGMQGAVGAWLALGAVAVFETFLFYGTYRAARARGITSALSATAGAWAAGVAALGLALAQLLVTGA